jgi:hypothetical protein
VKCLVFLCALLLGLALAQQPTPHRDLRYQGVVGQTDWFTCGPVAMTVLLRAEAIIPTNASRPWTV